MPAPRAITQIQEARVGTKITKEVVEGVQGNRYRIHGVWVPGADTQAKVGDVVHVQWLTHTRELDTPLRIVSYNVRRGSVFLPSEEGLALVEELFVDVPTGEVYFRNSKQITKLKVRELLPRDPDYVQFGIDGVYFVVRTSTPFTPGSYTIGQTPLYHIFKLNRTSGTKHLSATAVATFVRTESPVASNLALVDVRLVGAMTGSSKWAQGTTVHPGGIGDSTGTSISDISASASQDITRTIHLNVANHDGTSPFFFKSQTIDEVHVNEAGDLLIVLSVQVDLCMNKEHGIGIINPLTGLVGTQKLYVEGAECVFTPTLEDFGVADSDFSYPIARSHVFVINNTLGVILFRSCPPIITKTVTSEYHQFRGAQTHLFDSLGAELCGIARFDPEVWTGSDAGAPTVAFGNIGVHGHLGKSIDGWDTRLTFIGNPATFFTTVDIADSKSLEMAYGPSGAFPQGGLKVTYNRTLRQINHIIQWEIAGRFIPRLVKDKAGVGTVFLRARKVIQGVGIAYEVGAFMLDLETSVLTTIHPMTASPVGGQFIGSDIKVGFDDITFPWLDYVSAQNATAHEILMRVRYAPDATNVTDAIEVYNRDTEVLRVLDTVTTVQGDETHLPPDPALAPILAWTKRQFALLRPDFTFWAADADMDPTEQIFPAPAIDAEKDADIFLDIKKANVPGSTLTMGVRPKEFRDGSVPRTAGKRKKLPTTTPPPLLVPKRQNVVRDSNEQQEIYPGPSFRTTKAGS